MLGYLTETYALRETNDEASGALAVKGRTDGLAALQQAVGLMLQIERDSYAMFSADYGVAMSDLPGKPYSYVAPELERRIREALLADERILAVEDFHFSAKGNRLGVEFIVKSIYGDVKQRAEVNI